MDGVVGKPILPADLIREIAAASANRDTVAADETATG